MEVIFFAKIMLKFKKDFNAKIISLLMAVLFLLNSAVYGIDLPKNTPSKLRVPFTTNSAEGKRRLMETLSEITYHDHINNHITSQAQAQYLTYLEAEKLEDSPENLQKFYDSLPKYKNTDIAIMRINGLYENTKILEHIGLGRFYGKSIIYIDSSLKDKDREEILKHAYNEITGWDNERKTQGVEWGEMRNLILTNYQKFQAIADRIHARSNNINDILKRYGAQHKSDLLTVIASMPFKEGDVVIAALSRRDFLKLSGAALLAYLLYRTRLLGLIGYTASYPKSIPEELIPYMIVGIDEIPNDAVEGYVKERLWTKPENVRALTDASYHFNVSRVLAVSILSTEIFAMDSGVRRDLESAGSTLHQYDTFSEGIAQLQVRHAVRFFPALYEDVMKPGAPNYLKKAIEPYAYLYDSIGKRDDSGALIYFKEIKDILKNDVLCIYMMTMYIHEAMVILHESDPLFRDPNTLDAFSIPTAFEASAIGSYYVYGPRFALNPNATSIWDRIVGRDVSVPDYNIYKIKVHQNGWNWIELDKYLKQDSINGISMEYTGHRTFSEIIYWMPDVWAVEHATPYDPGVLGILFTNRQDILAQQIPPQYAYMASMFAHSPVYAFDVPYSYPNNWQTSQTPATPVPQLTQPAPVFVGDLPEGFGSDAQGIFYTVQEGDSLWNIATRVFSELNYLYRDAPDINYILDNIIIPLNPNIANRDTIIYPGQKIYVYSFASSNIGSLHRYSAIPRLLVNNGSPQRVFNLQSDGMARTRKEIAKILNRSERTIQPDLYFLVTAGLLIKKGRGPNATYKVNQELLKDPELIAGIQRILDEEFIVLKAGWAKKGEIKERILALVESFAVTHRAAEMQGYLEYIWKEFSQRFPQLIDLYTGRLVLGKDACGKISFIAAEILAKLGAQDIIIVSREEELGYHRWVECIWNGSLYIVDASAGMIERNRVHGKIIKVVPTAYDEMDAEDRSVYLGKRENTIFSCFFVTGKEKEIDWDRPHRIMLISDRLQDLEERGNLGDLRDTRAEQAVILEAPERVKELIMTGLKGQVLGYFYVAQRLKISINSAEKALDELVEEKMLFRRGDKYYWAVSGGSRDDEIDKNALVHEHRQHEADQLVTEGEAARRQRQYYTAKNAWEAAISIYNEISEFELAQTVQGMLDRLEEDMRHRRVRDQI